MKQKEKIINSIVSVMVVVILVVIAALVVGSILNSVIFTNITGSGSASNETILDVSNITARTVDNAGLDSFSMTLGIVTNATDGVVINSGNYTSNSSGNIIATDAGAISTFNGTDWNVTYTFTYDTGVNPTGLNTSLIAAQFGLFVTGLIAFLAIIGTIVGVVWLIVYVKALFDKKEGLQNITA